MTTKGGDRYIMRFFDNAKSNGVEYCELCGKTKTETCDNLKAYDAGDLLIWLADLICQSPLAAEIILARIKYPQAKLSDVARIMKRKTDHVCSNARKLVSQYPDLEKMIYYRPNISKGQQKRRKKERGNK